MTWIMAINAYNNGYIIPGTMENSDVYNGEDSCSTPSLRSQTGETYCFSLIIFVKCEYLTKVVVYKMRYMNDTYYGKSLSVCLDLGYKFWSVECSVQIKYVYFLSQSPADEMTSKLTTLESQPWPWVTLLEPRWFTKMTF